MWRAAAAWLGVPASEISLDYFGLNHLGWVRHIYHGGDDVLPDLLAWVATQGDASIPGLPFERGYLNLLGILPNEYNYFYTNTAEAVGNLQKAGMSRAQQIMPMNIDLYETLDHLRAEGADPAAMKVAYLHYLDQRHETYMSIETGHSHGAPPSQMDASAEGYSGVALSIIDALQRPHGGLAILNVPNRGTVDGMAADDVVEVTCYLGQGVIRPLTVGAIPDHALGLMKRVKAYERLTIQAAVQGSYDLALEALTLHPLVPSMRVAKLILDDYRQQHGAYFPTLN
jgi:6-phospho-beta-glucosidase